MDNTRKIIINPNDLKLSKKKTKKREELGTIKINNT